MNNKLSQIIFIVLSLLGALWAVSSLLDMHSSRRGIVFIYAGFAAVLLIPGRKLPYDGKFLIILCLGYAIGGKGFAYLTPMEPIYLSEFGLLLLMLGFAFRFQRTGGLAPTSLHLLIYLLMIYTAARLFIDFSEHGIYSIRDAATCYYALYFVGTYAVLQNARCYKAFSKAISWVLILGFLAQLSYSFLIYYKLQMISPWFGKIHLPHPDITLPLSVGFVVTCVTLFVSHKKIIYIPIIVLGVMILLLSKTAGIFDLMVVCIVLGVGARRKEILLGGMGFAVFAGFGFALLVTLSSGGNLPDFLADSKHIETIETTVTGDTSGRNTTDWRLEWWRTIYEDTMNKNPIFGVGFGGDITSSFFYNYYGEARMAGEAGTARYPHNIMFTIFGRLGISGILLFVPIMIWEFIFCCKFARRFLSQKHFKPQHMGALCIVVAGLGNSLVQATYETPYAAIIHWVFLGYLVLEYKKNPSGYQLKRN